MAGMATAKNQPFIAEIGSSEMVVGCRIDQKAWEQLQQDAKESPDGTRQVYLRLQPEQFQTPIQQFQSKGHYKDETLLSTSSPVPAAVLGGSGSSSQYSPSS